MTKIVKVLYGVGYGRHYDVLEFEDDATDEDIEQSVRDFVTDRLDWGYEIQSGEDEGSK